MLIYSFSIFSVIPIGVFGVARLVGAVWYRWWWWWCCCLLRLLLYVRFVRNKPPLRNFSTGLIPVMINYVGRGWLVMDGLNGFVRFYFKMLLIAAEKKNSPAFYSHRLMVKQKLKYSALVLLILLRFCPFVCSLLQMAIFSLLSFRRAVHKFRFSRQFPMCYFRMCDSVSPQKFLSLFFQRFSGYCCCCSLICGSSNFIDSVSTRTINLFANRFSYVNFITISRLISLQSNSIGCRICKSKAEFRTKKCIFLYVSIQYWLREINPFLLGDYI